MTESSAIILILYALIGICGALSVVVLVWGFIVYISRLGTERRDKGLDVMEWSVGLLITAIVLIGIMRLILWWIGV